MKHDEDHEMRGTRIPHTNGIGAGMALSPEGQKRLTALLTGAFKAAPQIADGFAERLSSGRLKPTDRAVIRTLATLSNDAAQVDRSWSEVGRFLEKRLTVFMTK